MPSSDSPPDVESATDFERELTDLVATAFARGVPIERTWEITIPVSAAPNWAIDVTKTYTDDTAAYEPEFVDDR